MGDRVLVQFKDSSDRVSPVCYMHWHGDRAPELIRECAKLMESRGEDLSYAFARFVGICHSHINGNLSLGVFNQAAKLTAEDSHGDAGCYVVNCKTWEVEAFGGYGESFNASPRYTMLKIAEELEATALNKAYHGNSLRVAKDFDFLTAEDRSVLDRYATGKQQINDHIELQGIANRVREHANAE